jgi:hypothetical protein
MTQRGRIIWPAMALGALALAAYANSFGTGFVFDSKAIILGDPRVRATTWEGISHIFSEHYWWPTATSDLYRPLTTLSYWFNWVVLGNEAQPLGYHAVNFALHLANVVLLWRLALRVATSRTIAWVAAALFAVHPLGVAAVTNLVGRADLFATLAVLLMALGWLRSEEVEGAARRRWRVAVAICGVLGLLAKENALMGGAGIALLILRRAGWRRGSLTFVREGAPVAAPMVLGFVAAQLWMRARTPPFDEVFVSNPVTDWHWMLTAIGVLGRYVVLLVWPRYLSCDYTHAQILPFGFGGAADVIPLASLIALTGLTVVTWRRRAAWPNFSFGLGWGAVMLFPTSNLIVHIGSIMAERFLYLPLTGFALAGAAMLVAAAERIGRAAGRPRMGLALPAACVLALGARTFIRNFDWKDARTLWTAALRVCPRSFNVQKGFALAQISDPVQEPELDMAIEHLEQARALLEIQVVGMRQEDTSVLTELGTALRLKAEFCAGRNELEAAKQWAERSRAVLEVAVAKNRTVGARVKRCYAERGDAEAAARTYGNPKIFLSLAQTQSRLNQIPEAEATLGERRLIDPDDPESPLLLGVLAAARGEGALAAARYMEAVLLRNNYERAWRELAGIYERMNVAPSPITVRPDGGNIEATSSLVRAHLEMALVDLVRTFRQAGRPAEAQAWEERAVREYGCRTEPFRG